MKQGTRDRELVPFLNETAEYYQRNISGGQLETYCTALRRWPLDRLLKARSMHYEDPNGGQFFPKIADFIRCIQLSKPANDETFQKIFGVHPDTPYQNTRRFASALYCKRVCGFAVKSALALTYEGPMPLMEYIADCSTPNSATLHSITGDEQTQKPSGLDLTHDMCWKEFFSGFDQLWTEHHGRESMA